MQLMAFIRRLNALLFLLPATLSWWPFPDNSRNSKSSHVTEVLPATVKFEMKTAEEKFIAEAQTFLQLHPLDKCLHNTVGKLRQSCSEIGEEELAKFSVLLLNCQSEAEGRPTYTCTEEMSMAECTQEMDPHTWNAYHIISNRARSVCYATRQQQFQMKTENVVNRLASSAEDQIDKMWKLKEGQEKIGQTVSDTLGIMSKGQDLLIAQQSRLKHSQSEISRTMTSNLNSLTREKSMIQSGQERLADMTEDIRRRLENATHQLENQDAHRRTNHGQLMTDLTQLRLKAKEVWDKIENNTKEIVQQHSVALLQYQEMLENIQRLNSSLNHVLGIVGQVDSQIDWVASQLGGNRADIQVIAITVQHACYLVMAMMCVVFLSAPWMSRLALVLVVPLNAMAQLKHLPYYMDFRQMTVTLASILIGDILLNWILSRKEYTASPGRPSLSLKQSQSEADSSPRDFSDSTVPCLTPEKVSTPIAFPASDRSYSKCQALTKSGLPCRLPQTPGSTFCKRHSHN